VALEEAGTVGHIMQCMEQQQMPLLVRPATVASWLKDMGLSYKRYRASLKKARYRRWGTLPGATRRGDATGPGGAIDAVFV
jgi:hypothetical protein